MICEPSEPSPTGRVLVVDDEDDAREMLAEALTAAGFEVVACQDGECALRHALGSSFDVCLSDVRMPGMDGLELLRRFGEASPETTVVLVTAFGDMETVVEALRAGAADFVCKPVLLDDVCNKVRHAVACRRLGLENRALRLQVHHDPRSAGHSLIGDSAPMRHVRELIARVAETESTVLITGESGTGKELVAAAVHTASGRALSPFVPINCGALPEGVLESELFGHTKGAFTGAGTAKEGLLVAARGGTVFLDEIGDLPYDMQVKLLRVLESREVQPVGSLRRIPIEARILAATNKDLLAEVEAGRFREDLYYRLAVFEIRCPALRERVEDIPAIASHLIHRLNAGLRVKFANLSGAAMRALVRYPWKGNVRELANVIERSMILADPPQIELEHLPASVQSRAGEGTEESWNLKDAVHHFEVAHIQAVLERCQGDKRRAAELLGIGLSSLYRKLDPAADEDAPLALAACGAGHPGP